MAKFIATLRFFVALPAFGLAVLAYGMPMLISGLVTTRWHFALFRKWATATIWWTRMKPHVDGLENISPDQQYIFVCNHQSLLDVPIVTALFPRRPRFVAKSSLSRIPFFNLILRCLGNICIDRKNRQAAIDSLHAAIRDRGSRDTAGVVFFAEGTRTDDGEIGPFKKGAVMTALDFQMPIVPMAIAGNFEALPKGAMTLYPGHVRLIVGKPIPVGPNTPEEKERLLQVVPDAVKALYESIRYDLSKSGEKIEQRQSERTQETILQEQNEN